tara:strand:+ start:340 stop:531 length:192 start_codon:yes stop_codon:yes gene_type:complete
LTSLGSGYFTFPVDIADTSSLDADSYSYELVQGVVSLKIGKVRVLEDSNENIIFDYTLDFLLS